jgi:hypothetical protein
VQAQVEEMYFIFNLEYRYAALSRGMLHRLSTKSHAQQKPKYPSEMSETQWPHTLHISLNLEKLDGFQTASFQIPDIPISKIRCSSFYCLVSND